MQSDFTDFSEDETKLHYRSQNLRGSLLECFKKNKMLAVKRAKQSLADVNCSKTEHISIDMKENGQPNSDKNSCHALSNDSRIKNKTTSIPKSIINLPNIVCTKVVGRLPLQQIKNNNIQIQKPMSTKHKQKDRVKKVTKQICTSSVQTDNNDVELQPLTKISIGIQTCGYEQNPVSAEDSLQSLRIIQLQQQLLIVNQKYRLQMLKCGKLEIQHQKLSNYNKQLMQKLMKHNKSQVKSQIEQIKRQVFSQVQVLAKQLEQKQQFFNRTLSLLQNQVNKLGYKVQISSLKKVSCAHDAQSLKTKISKYELQNQHLVSQLYLKSEETYKYWQCLSELHTFLQKTSIWNKTQTYYKQINFNTSLYQ